MSVNKCIFLGRLGSAPEIRYTASQMPVARVSMALNRPKKSDGTGGETDWIRLIAFGKTAEIMQKYTDKGHMLYVECHVSISSYKKKDTDETVWTTDFIVDRLELLGSQDKNASTNNNMQSNNGYKNNFNNNNYNNNQMPANRNNNNNGNFPVPEGFASIDEGDLPF